MNNILSHMKSLCMLAVLAVTAVCGSKLSAAEAGVAASPDKTYHIVYHDDYGNIIRRDAGVAGYVFHADDPFFFVTLPVTNTGWCVVKVEDAEHVPDGAKVYEDNETLPASLTEDLHLYPVTSYGKFIRFDSAGGTPVPYQFVHVGNKASRPNPPTKTGYTFDDWYIVNSDGTLGDKYNFNTPITVPEGDTEKDIKLKANWNPYTANYKVHIWLEKAEHPDRGTASNALAHFLDDYTYGGTITKTGLSEGNVSFNPASESTDNKNYINSLTQYKPTNNLTYTLYYYDNEDGSLAKAMSEAAITEINENGGIHADGSTTVNVFYRRMRYHLNIGYSENFRYQGDIPIVSNVQCAVDCPIRFEETIKSALARHNKTVSNPLGNLMDENTFTSNRDWAVTYMKDWIWGFEDEYPEGGMNAFIFPNPEDMYKDMDSPAEFSDGVNVYTYFLNTDYGVRKFIRQIYLQNLDSAGTTISDSDLTSLSKFTKHSQQNWIENGNTSKFYPYQYEGFTIYKRQIVKDNARTTYWNDNTGKPAEYSQSTNEYPYYSNSDGTNNQHWQVELFYTRNHHIVTFETFTNKITVTDNDKFNNVYYQQPLSVISSYIKHDGQTFVVGETKYIDDGNLVWVFEGWYDNAAFEGNPVDFTKYLMPDHNVMLYAKWSPKLINITFNADGGTIYSSGTYTVQIGSGTIPAEVEKPSSPQPGKLGFFSWTVAGKYYDYSEPFYEDTELVALYYAPPTNPLKVTYQAGRGTGTDVLEFKDYGYLYNANPEVQQYFTDWKAPKGKLFKCWVDQDGVEHDPDEEFIIKKDMIMTAQYEGGHADIVINRDDLLAGESATYTVYQIVDSTPVYFLTVAVTGDDSGNTATRKIVNVEPGTYKVVETPWAWAYGRGETTVTEPGKSAVPSGTAGTGVGAVDLNQTLTFTFTGDPKTDVSKHGESISYNEFK